MEVIENTDGKNWRKRFNAIFFISHTKKMVRLLKHRSFAILKYIDANISFDELINEYHFKKKYPLAANEIGIITCWGLGDTVMVAGLAHGLLSNGVAQKVVLIVKPGHEYIASIFPSVSKIYTLGEEIRYLDRQANNFGLRLQYLKPGQYFYAHFKNWEMTELLGYKGVTIIDCYRAILKLKKDINLERPKTLHGSAFTDAGDIFIKYDLIKGKTVLLATDSNSLTAISPRFWRSLTEKLIEAGFSVVLNSNSDQYLIALGAIYIDIPLSNVVPFSMLAGCVISTRSGLCDLLSLYDINMVVVYPDVAWYSGKVINGAAISKMWPAFNLKEVEVKAADDEHINDKYFGSMVQYVLNIMS